MIEGVGLGEAPRPETLTENQPNERGRIQRVSRSIEGASPTVANARRAHMAGHPLRVVMVGGKSPHAVRSIGAHGENPRCVRRNGFVKRHQYISEGRR